MLALGANRHDPSTRHEPCRSVPGCRRCRPPSSRSSATSPTRRRWSRCSPASPAQIDVIHTAGVIHPRRIVDFERINAGGTASMLDLARKHDARRFVHVSSNSPFGTNSHAGDRFRNEEPYHPYYGYGQSKMDAELAVFDAVEAGLDAVIVRPPWFYGPHQPLRQTTFFKLVRTGRFPVIGDGDQMRSMVYVDNLVDGVMRAELVPTPAGRGWWIADARPYAVREIVDDGRPGAHRRGLRRHAQPHTPAGDRGRERRRGGRRR